MIDEINDGEPVTYELLNRIIKEVNKLAPSESANSQNQIIDIAGSGIETTEDAEITVCVGKKNISVQKGQEKEFTIDFTKNFDTVPYVVASLVDVLPKQSGISFGSVTVTEITKQNCSMKVKLFSEEKTVTVQINYIAVGNAKTK